MVCGRVVAVYRTTGVVRDTPMEESMKSKTETKPSAPEHINEAPPDATKEQMSDLRAYLAEHPDYGIPVEKVDDKKLRDWIDGARDFARKSTRFAFFAGRVLLDARKKLAHGEAEAWQEEQAAKFDRSTRTLRLYMLVANAIDTELATPLPISILDRPLREVPRAIKDAKEGRDPDDPRTKEGKSSADPLASWRQSSERLVKGISDLPEEDRWKALVGLVAFVAELAKKEISRKDLKDFMALAQKQFRTPKPKPDEPKSDESKSDESGPIYEMFGSGQEEVTTKMDDETKGAS